MGKYVLCLNCSNMKKGDSIYRCNECDGIFCSSCLIRAFTTNKCPHRDSDPGWFGGKWTTMGKIEG